MISETNTSDDTTTASKSLKTADKIEVDEFLEETYNAVAEVSTKKLRTGLFTNIGDEPQEELTPKDKLHYRLVYYHLNRFHGRVGRRGERFNTSTGFVRKLKDKSAADKAMIVAYMESRINKIQEKHQENLSNALEKIDSETAELLRGCDKKGDIMGSIEALDKSQEKAAVATDLLEKNLAKDILQAENYAIKRIEGLRMFEEYRFQRCLRQVLCDHLKPFTRFEKGDSLRRSVLRKAVLSNVVENQRTIADKYYKDYSAKYRRPGFSR